MSKMQTEVKGRRLSPHARVVLWIFVGVLTVRYHKELYVFMMIHCGGLRLNPTATSHVLAVDRSLLDDELKGAATQDEKISILRQNLQHKYSWVQSHAIQFISGHKDKFVAPLFLRHL